jgi:hypothetical protein
MEVSIKRGLLHTPYGCHSVYEQKACRPRDLLSSWETNYMQSYDDGI